MLSFRVSPQPQWVYFPSSLNELFTHHDKTSNAPRNRTKCRPRRVFRRSIGPILGSTTWIGCIAAVARRLATQGTVGGREKGALVVYEEASSTHRVVHSVGRREAGDARCQRTIDLCGEESRTQNEELRKNGGVRPKTPRRRVSRETMAGGLIPRKSLYFFFL